MTIRQRWSLRVLMVSIAIMTSLGILLISSGTASAASPGAYNSHFPNQVSGCLSNNVRARDIVYLYTTARFYGWAEQRYSPSGNCYGYQWIRLHVTNTMVIVYDEPTFVVSEQELGGNNYSFTWGSPIVHNGYVYPGTYDLPMMYVTTHEICATIDNFDSIGLLYFFGHNYTPNNDYGEDDWCA